MLAVLKVLTLQNRLNKISEANGCVLLGKVGAIIAI